MSVSESLGIEKRVDLPQGTISYRERGTGDPLVFVHGLLVNGDLWRKVVPELSKDFRCIAPDWPLGSHSVPMSAEADLTPAGVAKTIGDFLEALDLDNVTLVANDSGGALSQILVTTNPARVDKLVLTSCDGFEIFPPRMFQYLSTVAKIPGAMFVLGQSMRIPVTRRMPNAYGALWNKMPEREVMNSYVGPVIHDGDVRRDLAKFLKALSPTYTQEASRKLKNFDKPVLLAWDDEDRFFKWELAQRIAKAFPNSRLEKIENSRTFVAEDQPEALVKLVREFVREPVNA